MKLDEKWKGTGVFSTTTFHAVSLKWEPYQTSQAEVRTEENNLKSGDFGQLA
ncbi:MAG: hypothetical protein NTY09_07045 [bacterium]|nr:hypothetical protein [bacterium]